MKTQIAVDIENAELKRQLDQQSKSVLSNKHVLAIILKNTVKEVKDMSIDQIIESIEGTPNVGNIGVLEETEKITGENTEDSSITEGTLYYDIRFSIITGKEKQIKILFDIEAQKDYYPGYKIVTRGIVYCGRMISSQIGREFNLRHYDGLKKVYSIWICFNPPEYVGNAISYYSMEKHDILLGIPDDPEAYDKLTVIQICLSEDSIHDGNTLTDMLNTLFSHKKSSAMIKSDLEGKYGIPMEITDFGKEIDHMCNLSELIEERGIKEGKIELLIELVKDHVLSVKDAAQRLGLTEKEFRTYM